MTELQLRNRMKQILMEKARLQGLGMMGGDLINMGGSIMGGRLRKKKRKVRGGSLSGGEMALEEYNKLLKKYKKRVGYVPGSKEQLKEIRRVVSDEYRRDRGEQLKRMLK